MKLAPEVAPKAKIDTIKTHAIEVRNRESHKEGREVEPEEDVHRDPEDQGWGPGAGKPLFFQKKKKI